MTRPRLPLLLGHGVLAILVAAHGLWLALKVLEPRVPVLDNPAPFSSLLWGLVLLEFSLAGLTASSAYAWHVGASRIPMVAWTGLTAAAFGALTAWFVFPVIETLGFVDRSLVLPPSIAALATGLAAASLVWTRDSLGNDRR